VPSAIALTRRRPRTVVAMAALMAAGLFAAPASFWQRMGGLAKATNVETIGQMDPEGSARERFAVMQTALRILSDHPMLGVGLGAYQRVNAEYSPSIGRKDTHNTYLNVATETGIPGLLIFLAAVGSVFWFARDAGSGLVKRRGAVRDPDAERVYWLRSALAGYFVAAVFGSYARISITYLFISLVWTAARAVRAAHAQRQAVSAPTQAFTLATQSPTAVVAAAAPIA